jgi:ATP-dependent RNA helicase RhlE
MPFNNLGLHPTLVQAIHDMRYAEPTPIQAEAIPVILAGRDLIATAQTGTGKTAAFLLPILHRLLDLPRSTTQALIITPTRELAQQIDDVCLGLAYHTGLRVGLLVGGAPMGPQEKAIRAGVELLVATPGRLLDHMRSNQSRFDHLHTLVLDEADRMLDMGFLPDIKRIVARLPARQQTLMFSATMPPVIVKLAKDILRNPLSIAVGKRSAPAVGITQAAYPVPEHLKTALLRHLLRSMDMPSVLVFARTKLGARRLARIIKADGFDVAELHGDLEQKQRDKAMDGFRNGDYQVLVATNVAARGLDVDHITHVISFDVPSVPDDYIHRIGRTGRAKSEGDAFVLVSPVEEKSLSRIERQIGQRLPRISLPDFDYAQVAPPKSDRPSSRGGRGRRSRREGSGHSQRGQAAAKPPGQEGTRTPRGHGSPKLAHAQENARPARGHGSPKLQQSQESARPPQRPSAAKTPPAKHRPATDHGAPHDRKAPAPGPRKRNSKREPPPSYPPRGKG